MRAALPPAARATPRGRQWTKERVVEDADPYGGWETGRVPHNMPRVYPTPGRGSAERGGAGKNRDGGTSRTPSPTGLVRVLHGARIRQRTNARRAGVEPRPYEGVGGTR